MATTYHHAEHDIYVTRLSGGERGICYQISTRTGKFIILTETEFEVLQSFQIGSANHKSQGWNEE